ncbi:hypothetical protein [Streptosporangium sp. NPDC000396]|uniref:hypothetical protein n=1 Tax=Streptosporangium sp. NPDC000396 TaxID=3366185 RepID=UPI0036C76030
MITACLAKDPADRPAVGDILDKLTASALTATRWLPPDITTMIVERGGTKGTPTAVSRDPEPATIGMTAIGRETSADRANLKVGNLSQRDLDVILDDTVLGTIYAGGSSTFYVGPGVHSVQVKSGPQRSALRRIETRAGATVRLAFDVPPGRAGTGLESADTATFSRSRASIAIPAGVGWMLFSAGFGALALVAGLLIEGTDRVKWEVVLPFIGVWTLGAGVLVSLIALAVTPTRLTLDSNGLTLDPGSKDKRKVRSISWDTLSQVSLIGDGYGAKLVVWYREEHRPPAGSVFQGGTVVCGARQVTDKQGLSRIRGALTWFAGDLYVEQPT